jgi:hypothetical protein
MRSMVADSTAVLAVKLAAPLLSRTDRNVVLDDATTSRSPSLSRSPARTSSDVGWAPVVPASKNAPLPSPAANRMSGVVASAVPSIRSMSPSASNRPAAMPEGSNPANVNGEPRAGEKPAAPLPRKE